MRVKMPAKGTRKVTVHKKEYYRRARKKKESPFDLL
jgi:hypothetical protein